MMDTLVASPELVLTEPPLALGCLAPWVLALQNL